MMPKLYQVVVPHTPLKKNKHSKTIDSECLYGENFYVLNSEGNYSYGISAEDNYEGWLKSDSIALPNNTNYLVSSLRSCVLSEPNVKSQLLFFLSMRSKINVLEIINNWAKIALCSRNKIKYGYILRSHITEVSAIKTDWVKYAEQFLGTPYRWGGRNSIGLDCSALLQLSKSFANEALPRDTKDQINYFFKSKKYKIYKKNHRKLLNRGNLIFWEGHVAIVLDKFRLIHASGFHGLVVTEKIKSTVNRINKETYYVVDKID